MHAFRIRAAAILVLAGSPSIPLTAAPTESRPNFVLCMADDQGWGDVGYYGHSAVQTPVLDEMAASGLRFDRFYAAAPVCSPTRGSVMTGRHPNRFGCFSWGRTLRPQETTIAEALRDAGYATGHFGKWHLGSVRADSPVCPGASGFDEWLSTPNFYENDPLMSLKGKVIRAKGESSMIPVEYALDFAARAVKQKKPFLAVVWFGSPHAPHIAVPELRELYQDRPKRERNFLGEITGIDRAMGRLRKGLAELGVSRDTLLWYTSDNGALAVGSTGGLRGRKGSLWEGGLRVPCIIEWPRVIQSPRRIEGVAGTVDIFPTLLDIAGVERAPGVPLDGQSIAGWIRGQDTRRARPLGFWVYPKGGIGTPSEKLLEALRGEQEAGRQRPASEAEPDPAAIPGGHPEDDPPGHAAWLDGRYKLHRIPEGQGFSYKLFDLEVDPAEKDDVAARHPERTERMKTELAAWQRSVARSLNGQDYSQ